MVTALGACLGHSAARFAHCLTCVGVFITQQITCHLISSPPLPQLLYHRVKVHFGLTPSAGCPDLLLRHSIRSYTVMTNNRFLLSSLS